MRRPLAGPGVTVPDVLRATEGIMPSLEIGDSRMRDWIGRAQVADILADSCGAAGIIVGGELHPSFDLYTGMVVSRMAPSLPVGRPARDGNPPTPSPGW
jgi:2-keto-4-pentenoate hydratase